MTPKQQRVCTSVASASFKTKHKDRFYLGKKVAFVYRAHREVRGTKIRVIWGKITRPHGMSRPGHCSMVILVQNADIWW